MLSTGGPAVRIIGELNNYKEPGTATLQCQDWFTEWVDYPTDSDQDELLLQYAHFFPFYY